MGIKFLNKFLTLFDSSIGVNPYSNINQCKNGMGKTFTITCSKICLLCDVSVLANECRHLYSGCNYYHLQHVE